MQSLWSLIKISTSCVSDFAWISAKLDENCGFFIYSEVLSLPPFLCITLYLIFTPNSSNVIRCFSIYKIAFLLKWQNKLSKYSKWKQGMNGYLQLNCTHWFYQNSLLQQIDFDNFFSTGTPSLRNLPLLESFPRQSKKFLT